MTYRQWYEEFGNRHRAVIGQLAEESGEELIEYFLYENMRRLHPDFCPLYTRGEKCHDLEELNCYLCGCPHFRYCDDGIDTVEGKVRYSLCAIDAKEGRRFETEEAIHQDCSGCPLPHLSGFIRRHFDRDWAAVMAECEQCH